MVDRKKENSSQGVSAFREDYQVVTLFISLLILSNYQVENIKVDPI